MKDDQRSDHARPSTPPDRNMRGNIAAGRGFGIRLTVSETGPPRFRQIHPREFSDPFRTSRDYRGGLRAPAL
jgi:hypothetical protein